MTMAYVLKSRVRRESHARFGSGGWGREAPADHNYAAQMTFVINHCKYSQSEVPRDGYDEGIICR